MRASASQSQAAPVPDYGGGLVAEVEICGCDESLALRAEVARLRARLRRLLARPAAERAAPLPAAPPSSSRKRKGIYWHAESGKWRARVQVEGKRVYLGAFASEDEAARAVESALRVKEASRG